jgi:hypothetical protein
MTLDRNRLLVRGGWFICDLQFVIYGLGFMMDYFGG